MIKLENLTEERKDSIFYQIAVFDKIYFYLSTIGERIEWFNYRFIILSRTRMNFARRGEYALYGKLTKHLSA